jgi:hypothetical protein
MMMDGAYAECRKSNFRLLAFVNAIAVSWRELNSNQETVVIRHDLGQLLS